MVVGVASIHHHSRIPFELYAQVLREDGFSVFGDWHHRLWMHPGSVYRMLEQLEFSDKSAKENTLESFLNTFRRARYMPALPQRPEDRRAMREIMTFWQAMGNISQEMGLEGTPLWFLEGHRDVREYIKEMRKVGLNTRSQDIRTIAALGFAIPYQVLPYSSLLQVTIGQRLAA